MALRKYMHLCQTILHTERSVLSNDHFLLNLTFKTVAPVCVVDKYIPGFNPKGLNRVTSAFPNLEMQIVYVASQFSVIHKLHMQHFRTPVFTSLNLITSPTVL